MAESEMKSDSYAGDVLKHLKDLYARQVLCDATIIAEDGKEFKTHKALLASSSVYFSSLIEKEEKRHQYDLKNIDSTVFAVILEFLYSGHLHLTLTTVSSILSAASHLQINHAIDLCRKYLVDHITESEQNLDLDGMVYIVNDANIINIEPESLVIDSHETDNDLYCESPVKATPPRRSQRKRKIKRYGSDEVLTGDLTLPAKVAKKDERLVKTPAKVLSSKAGPSKGRQGIHKIQCITKPSEKQKEGVANGKAQVKESFSNIDHDQTSTYDNISEISSTKNCDVSLNEVQSETLNPILSKKGSRRPRIIDAVKQFEIHQSDGNVQIKQEQLHFSVKPQTSTTRQLTPRKQNRKSVHDEDFNIQKLLPLNKFIKTETYSLFFNCTICGINFKTKGEHIWHKNKYHRISNKCVWSIQQKILYRSLSEANCLPFLNASNGKNLYTCKQCGKSCTLKSGFLKHFRQNHLYTKSCDKCKVQLPCSKLNVHMLRKHSKMAINIRNVFSCKVCNQQFHHLDALKKHMYIHRKVKAKKHRVQQTKQPKMHHCNEDGCKFMTFKERELVLHMKASHPHTEFYCEICDFKTCVKTILFRHRFKEHKIVQKNHECHHCHRQFASKRSLHIHLFSKHRVTTPGLDIRECEEAGCQYACVGERLLQQHLKSHQAEKSFQCDQCDKKLKTKLSLQKHMNKMHLHLRPFVCDVCGMTYGEESELKTHMVRHSAWKQFQCSECSYSSHDKATYSYHMYCLHQIKVNADMRIISCTVCDFKTPCKSRFDDHMRSHLNVRDVECPHCSKFFMTRKALRGHVIKVHQPKDLKCDHCGYATGCITKLKEHVRVRHTHRHIKPFKCAYCAFVCATSGNCRKHVMQRHKGEDVKYVKLVERLPDPDVTIAIDNATGQKHVRSSIDPGGEMSDDLDSDDIHVKVENVIELDAENFVEVAVSAGSSQEEVKSDAKDDLPRIIIGFDPTSGNMKTEESASESGTDHAPTVLVPLDGDPRNESNGAVLVPLSTSSSGTGSVGGGVMMHQANYNPYRGPDLTSQQIQELMADAQMVREVVQTVDMADVQFAYNVLIP